jgi:membrane associated rhomboid family serine protease
MFGADPDLLCDTCAQQLRDRLAPKATGRLLSSAVSGPTPVTLGLLLVSGVLFVLTHVVYKKDPDLFPDWLWLLWPGGPTGTIGTGQAWRLFTSALIHLGWLHVIFNSIWIWDLGRAVESTKGWVAFALIVLGSAVTASGVQWYFSGAGVGLSGVLYALAGFLWCWRKRDPIAATVMNPGVTRLLAVWLVVCIFLPYLRIANWAHGAGVVWGIAAGRASLQRRPWPWYVLLGAATVGIVLLVSTGHRYGHVP